MSPITKKKEILEKIDDLIQDLEKMYKDCLANTSTSSCGKCRTSWSNNPITNLETEREKITEITKGRLIGSNLDLKPGNSKQLIHKLKEMENKLQTNYSNPEINILFKSLKDLILDVTEINHEKSPQELVNPNPPKHLTQQRNLHSNLDIESLEKLVNKLKSEDMPNKHETIKRIEQDIKKLKKIAAEGIGTKQNHPENFSYNTVVKELMEVVQQIDNQPPDKSIATLKSILNKVSKINPQQFVPVAEKKLEDKVESVGMNILKKKASDNDKTKNPDLNVMVGHLENLFKELDTNGNGSVDMAEFKKVSGLFENLKNLSSSMVPEQIVEAQMRGKEAGDDLREGYDADIENLKKIEFLKQELADIQKKGQGLTPVEKDRIFKLKEKINYLGLTDNYRPVKSKKDKLKDTQIDFVHGEEIKELKDMYNKLSTVDTLPDSNTSLLSDALKLINKVLPNISSDNQPEPKIGKPRWTDGNISD